MKNLSNHYQNNCKVCNLIASKNSTSIADQILTENDSYFAISSIGAFIPGWTLIFSKDHKLNLASDYSNSNFINFANYVSNKVTEEYGKCVVFEHGSNVEGSATSCGVNHAHLHIVPFSENIESLSQSDSLDLSWQVTNINLVSALSNSQEYLFCSNELNVDKTTGLFTILTKPRSQFFRQVLAKSTGLIDFYDYKRYRFEDISIDSSKRLSKKFLISETA